MNSAHGFLLAVVPLLLTAGCATPNSMHLQRDQLVALLQREMRENTGWERVHAADALCDHHATEDVATFFKDQTETAGPTNRIGVWRIMARVSATGAERQRWVERLRSVMLTPEASDRLSADESLAKLGVSLPADSTEIEKWIAQADEATAPFPLWLLVLSSTADERNRREARLANLLESTDAIARLRASFALGRLATISPDSRARLRHCAESEPADSPARAYLLSAALLQCGDDASFAGRTKRELLHCLLKGNPAEQLEAAIAIGKCGTAEDAVALRKLINHSEPDARIGAASGLLHLMR